MADEQVRILQELLHRQDEYIDDTFELLSKEYDAALGEAVREVEDLVETTTDGRLAEDVDTVARARLKLQLLTPSRAIWQKWSKRLERVRSFSDDYFGAGPSDIENSLVEELVGLWPSSRRKGSGLAGRFFQLSTHHRQQVADAVTRHVLGRSTKRALVDELAQQTGRSSNQAEALFRDSTVQFSRSVQARRAEDQGFVLFQYFGPLDSITRPFCRPLVGNVYSRDEIDAMDNGQTGVGSVMVAGGGYNCRHHWQPVREEWIEASPSEERSEEDGVPVEASFNPDVSATQWDIDNPLDVSRATTWEDGLIEKLSDRDGFGGTEEAREIGRRLFLGDLQIQYFSADDGFERYAGKFYSSDEILSLDGFHRDGIIHFRPSVKSKLAVIVHEGQHGLDFLADNPEEFPGLNTPERKFVHEVRAWYNERVYLHSIGEIPNPDLIETADYVHKNYEWTFSKKKFDELVSLF